MKSMFRHFMDAWLLHRNPKATARETIEFSLCALLFNAAGYLHEVLKARKFRGV